VNSQFVGLEAVEEEGAEQLDGKEEDEREEGVGGGEGGEEDHAAGAADETPEDAGEDEGSDEREEKEDEGREREEGEGCRVTVESAGEADAAQDGGIERELPGDERSGDSVVTGGEVEEETAPRHRVDGVCADGLGEVVEDWRGGVASHHEEECFLDRLPGPALVPQDQRDEPDQAQTEGHHEDGAGQNVS